MGNTHQDLEEIKQQCISGFRAYCEQEMKTEILNHKIQLQKARELETSRINEQQQQIAIEKWKHVKDESEKLSETSMLAYESFTSMLCKIGSLCVDLNLAIYNERPLSASFRIARKAFCTATGIDEQALIQSWSARLEPTLRELQNIQNILDNRVSEINDNRANLPEIKYSITYDTNEDPSLKIDLHVPNNLPMAQENKDRIKSRLQDIFIRFLARNQHRMDNGKIQTVPGVVGGVFRDITNDEFNALRYNAGQDRFAMYLDGELNNVAGLKLRTIDSEPFPIPRPGP